MAGTVAESPRSQGRSLGGLFRARDNNFHLIRLCAALLVIYGHSFALAKPGSGTDFFTALVGWGFSGGLAVDTFFVISGFLVTGSILGQGLRHYAVSRVLRIYPALIVCVAILVFVLGPAVTVSGGYWESPDTYRYFRKVASAYSMEWFLPGVFRQHRDSAVNGSIWSLVVEVRMYLLVAVLYGLGILRRTVLFNLLAITALIGGYWYSKAIPLGWSSTDYHVSSMFLLGMLCWVNRDRIPVHAALAVPLLVGAVLVRGTPHFIAGYSLVVCYCVFLAAFAPGFGWFRHFGDYSYGVFLYGWPVQQCVMMFDLQMPAWKNAAISCPIALALGVVSWYGIERHALKLKRRFGGTPKQNVQPEQASPHPRKNRARRPVRG